MCNTNKDITKAKKDIIKKMKDVKEESQDKYRSKNNKHLKMKTGKNQQQLIAERAQRWIE